MRLNCDFEAEATAAGLRAEGLRAAQGCRRQQPGDIQNEKGGGVNSQLGADLESAVFLCR